MDTVIWIAQIVLAGMFLFAGLLKLTQPKEKLIDSGQAWVEDFDPRQVKGIATLELLAAIGLILPAALDIVPVLTPGAASGLVFLMLGRERNARAAWRAQHPSDQPRPARARSVRGDRALRPALALSGGLSPGRGGCPWPRWRSARGRA
jgi:hypothetical protein